MKTTIFIAFILLAAIVSNAQTKIACIGNSITAGTAVGGPANAYPAYLQTLLGTKYVVHNDGVTTTTMLKKGDLPYWQHGMLPDVFSFLPNIITIKLGTNDTKPQNWDAHYMDFKKDYIAMIDTLASVVSHPKIWLILPVPVLITNYGINDTALQKIIPIIKQIALEKALPVIDANTPLKNHMQWYNSDGVHPNAVGEDTIAHIIYRALTAPTSLIASAHSTTPSSETSMGRLCMNGFSTEAMLKVPENVTGLEVYSLQGKKLFQCRFNGIHDAEYFKGIKVMAASEVVYVKYVRK